MAATLGIAGSQRRERRRRRRGRRRRQVSKVRHVATGWGGIRQTAEADQEFRGGVHLLYSSYSSSGEVDRGRCHFPFSKLLLLAVLRRTRAACSKTSFRTATTLRRFRGCSATTNLPVRPEPTAQRASAASSECCLCSLSGCVAFTGCLGLAQAGPSGGERSGSHCESAAKCHRV